jgi:hypothetical protein
VRGFAARKSDCISAAFGDIRLEDAQAPLLDTSRGKNPTANAVQGLKAWESFKPHEES